MGLTFFNAQRARQKELENSIKPQSILEEQPTSPDTIGEVGTSIENEIEEIKPKTIKKKRK
jgi:hypothetical protein